MGGCLDHSKKSGIKKVYKPIVENKNEKILAYSSIRNQPIMPKSKYKKIIYQQLLFKYIISNTVQMSCKMEGPKYLSNRVDGSATILRIYNQQDIDEKRMEVYKDILGLQILEDDQKNILIFDKYCSGQDIIEISQKNIKTQNTNNFLNYLKQIYDIILKFHQMKIALGNLNMSSFRKISQFNNEIRLVDINLSSHQKQYEKVGHAHKEGYKADWEFFGYILQLLTSQQPPLFMPHKMQYIEMQQKLQSSKINRCLKGQCLAWNQILQIKNLIRVPSCKIYLGYKFRLDINKLLKMRRKRKPHRRIYYGEDLNQIQNEKFHQDIIYRYETDRILRRIETYIEQLRIQNEQSFIMYGIGGDKLKRFKQVFLYNGIQKKMNQLKQCLNSIK